jgi:lipopolysaccharide transport system ATP-binding protein
MSDVVIRAEGLGKRYLIGHESHQEGYTALRDVIARTAKGLARSSRDMMRGRQLIAGEEVEEFWALRDVGFEIRRGEVVGIIGRNGAGKSTLLKILSRITEPSAGRVAIKGRVATLLEVGTGFHPELTGRENIFLNGAILGMSRAEIKRKFEEIVAFAEVSKFLDTPVKRYSSGMYVRLAFAVAAHLEPEILVVDEVLAVGDFEFQKKCRGKMGEVARGGRTVLFVSHNMAAIAALTRDSIWLERGKVKWTGKSDEAVAKYTSQTADSDDSGRICGRGRHSRIISVQLVDRVGSPTLNYVPGSAIKLVVLLETDGSPGLSVELFLNDPSNRRLGYFSLAEFCGHTLPRSPGLHRCELRFSPIWLAAGSYRIDVATSIHNVSWDHFVDGAIGFEVVFSNPGGLSWDYRHSHEFGSVALQTLTSPLIAPCNAPVQDLACESS